MEANRTKFFVRKSFREINYYVYYLINSLLITNIRTIIMREQFVSFMTSHIGVITKQRSYETVTEYATSGSFNLPQK